MFFIFENINLFLSKIKTGGVTMKKERVKKFICIQLCCIMIFAFAATVFADGGNDNDGDPPVTTDCILKDEGDSH